MFGQTSAINGEITGTVTDPSGAAIAGATVQATNTDTGLKQIGEDQRQRAVPHHVLPLGSYELEVQAAGFGPRKVTGIVAERRQRPRQWIWRWRWPALRRRWKSRAVGHHHRAEPHRSGQHAGVRT